jgi:hypothetical protein
MGTQLHRSQNLGRLEVTMGVGVKVKLSDTSREDAPTFETAEARILYPPQEILKFQTGHEPITVFLFVCLFVCLFVLWEWGL